MPLSLYITLIAVIWSGWLVFLAVLLWFLCRLFRTERPSFVRALVAVVGLFLLSGVTTVFAESNRLAVALLAAAAATVVWVLIIRWAARARIWRGIAITAVYTLALLPPAYAFRAVMQRTVAGTYVVPTGAMAPVIAAGDSIVVDSTLWPQRWDVVVYISPRGRELLLGRVVGMPGERVETIDGGVRIDGEQVEPPRALVYEQSRGEASYGGAGSPLTLGRDTYFMLDDNSPVSLNSRHLGPIHSARITGTVRLVYWPLRRAGAVR